MKKSMLFARLIVFSLGIGFFVLGFEIYLQHYDLLNEKRIMWTPIVFGFAGGVVTVLIALFFNKIGYYLFYLVMFISILVGSLGLYLHNRWRFPSFIDFLFHGKGFNFEILTTYTPLLAPSAFIAMGSLGILVAMFHKWGD